ncbi:gamma-glutamyl-gamma-aminobutyrate hydrolase family protein [Gordonia paraffinivorans]|uniref:Glutamine amidotransferase Rv2859c n=1 Tax=Gordonia paraffinivorans TaxID=175628 RepID=A0ABD7V2Y0_9ACTN|nr:gamma-glutamyl-gamma-aminobutyrate hydrolase family protein [Gordonia paraffinivorans]VFA88688.1 Putative glutamine amidotransferase Rv2859c [Gordonia paraffinivorans]
MTKRPVIAVTYSIAELPILIHWRRMFEGINASGATALALDTGSHIHHDMDTVMGNVDGLIISGGGDIDPTLYGGDPDDTTLWGVNDVRDGNEIAALRSARARGLPVLAICRGFHLVNASMGGTLWQDLLRDHPTSVRHRLGEENVVHPAHRVHLDDASAVARWTGAIELEVNSQHHQGIRELAPGLRPVAHSADSLVEGFETEDGLVVGIQWHPELFWHVDDHAAALLRGFTESCARDEAHVPG